MTGVNAWLHAARLRTLPLSVSGIIIAAGIALFEHAFSWAVFVGSLLVTLLLQILSNIANDYGDGVKGIDNENRVGPARALQSGMLTSSALKTGVYVLSALVIISVVALLWVAQLTAKELFVFAVMALFAVAAAIAYTMGDKPYGYRGLGDLMVFIFFGGVAVIAGSYLYLKEIHLTQGWFAISIGAFSTAVLNLNNLRDEASDRKSNKQTLVVRLGYRRALMYHHIIIITGFFAYIAGVAQFSANATLVAVPLAWLFRGHLQRVRKAVPGTPDLDPELKRIAMISFFSALFVLILVVSLPLI